ncbi:DUF1997 domain-containing protein [Gloeobacter violaceus]|uniref:Glr3497 protein n=1 Tax=Gloeobacter violaceus (strain ATCC 29082 / PCC 7421) TaxID=251221 RepID=Q7NFM7_GLOVI|nr:DUF1997 domain-containing protein [Gloeobacter violaceus]BAC91438.1 glr3497 [Gloeobacter violaceus PCC 7421]
MSTSLSLKDTQRGDVRLETDLPPLAGYLRKPDHWIPVGFRPLKVEAAAGTYRLQLPEFGALGFRVAPRVALRVVEEDERLYRLHSVPLPDPGYAVDFDGLFRLDPAARAVAVFWEANFGIRIELPGFLGMFPQPVVQAAAQAAVSAMNAGVCRSLVGNICRDFRARPPGSP